MSPHLFSHSCVWPRGGRISCSPVFISGSGCGAERSASQSGDWWSNWCMLFNAFLKAGKVLGPAEGFMMCRCLYYGVCDLRPTTKPFSVVDYPRLLPKEAKIRSYASPYLETFCFILNHVVTPNPRDMFRKTSRPPPIHNRDGLWVCLHHRLSLCIFFGISHPQIFRSLTSD